MNYSYESDRAISEDRIQRNRERELERQRQERIRDASPALLAACKKLEWSDRDSFYNPRCPDCVSLEKHGHDDKCELKAAITMAEKGK